MVPTVMSSTRARARRIRLPIVLLAAGAMVGCTTEEPHLGSDFGAMVREHFTAQIADPEQEAAAGGPVVTDGAKVAAAIKRYETGKVIQPQSATAFTVTGAAVPEPTEAK